MVAFLFFPQLIGPNLTVRKNAEQCSTIKVQLAANPFFSKGILFSLKRRTVQL